QELHGLRPPALPPPTAGSGRPDERLFPLTPGGARPRVPPPHRLQDPPRDPRADPRPAPGRGELRVRPPPRRRLQGLAQAGRGLPPPSGEAAPRRLAAEEAHPVLQAVRLAAVVAGPCLAHAGGRSRPGQVTVLAAGGVGYIGNPLRL